MIRKLKRKSQVETDTSKPGIAPTIIDADTVKVYLPDRNGLSGSNGQADSKEPVDSLGLAIIFKKFHPVEKTACHKENTGIELLVLKGEPNGMTDIQTGLQHGKSTGIIIDSISILG